MRKTLASIVIFAFMLGGLGCANWNRMTPKPLDNTAIEEEIRKNMAADGITGMKIDVSNGVVTLEGRVKTSSDRQKAYDDAAKVNGVKRVINRISVGS
jgi:osmotically-inducible protein OsmY